MLVDYKYGIMLVCIWFVCLKLGYTYEAMT